MSSFQKELRQGALVNFIGILGKMAGPGLLLLINQLYGTAIFGLYMTGNIIIELSLALLISGFKSGSLIFVSRHVDDSSEHHKLYQAMANALLWSILLGVMISATILLSGDVLLPKIYGAEYGSKLVPLLNLMAITVPFMAIEKLIVASTQGLKEMKFDAIIDGGMRPSFLLAFSFLYFYLDKSVVGIGYAYVTTQMIIFVYALYIYSIRFNWSGLFNAIANFSLNRELISFAIPQNLNTALNRFTTGIDILMLPALGASSLLVGIYATGSSIVREVRHIKLGFSGAFNPHIVRFFKDGEVDKLSETFSLTANWIASLTFPALLIIAIMNVDLLDLISDVPVDDALFMLLLLPVPYFYNSFSLAGNIVVMTGHSMYNLMNSLTVSSLNIGLNLWLIPKYGLSGAAIASAIATFIITILENIEARYLTGAQLRVKSIFKPHLAGFAMLSLLIYLERTYFAESLFPDRLILMGIILFGYVIIYSALDYRSLKRRLRTWLNL